MIAYEKKIIGSPEFDGVDERRPGRDVYSLASVSNVQVFGPQLSVIFECIKRHISVALIFSRSVKRESSPIRQESP